MNLITRYRKEMIPIIESLEHMPGGRKVIITDPKTELLELVYKGMKTHGGTLIIIDPDILEDTRLRDAVYKIMLNARSYDIAFCLLWSKYSSCAEEELR